jgi:hypothetical protein
MHVNITRQHFKLAAKTIIGYSVGSVIKQVIDNNTNEPDKKSEEVALYVGSRVLGSVVGEIAWKHMEPRVDKVVEYDYAGKIADAKSKLNK